MAHYVTLGYSAVILEKYIEQFFSKGFSTDNGRNRSQLTTKKSQEKSSVIFAQNVHKVALINYN